MKDKTISCEKRIISVIQSIEIIHNICLDVEQYEDKKVISIPIKEYELMKQRWYEELIR
jgi:hypothetical protein